MASIVGADGLMVRDIYREIGEGARFVVYQYCVSVILMSFKNSSAVHFVRPGQRVWGSALPLTAVSLVAGWWGIPWGPIWTVTTVASNLSGGKDVTEEVMAALSECPEDMRITPSGEIAQLGSVFD